MRILIVDNNIMPEYWGSWDLRRYAVLAPGASVYVRRGPQGDLPASPEGFDRIVISGSATAATDDAPWIDQLLKFIRRATDSGRPLLGVCYGHQMLNRALGGKDAVRRAAEAEFGWTRIEVLEDSPLMQGFPKVFHSFSAHFDEVSRLAPGMKRLARSPDCDVQACQLGDRPVFGIQFHPEKDLADGERTFRERRAKGTPERLLNEKDGRRLYDPVLSERLFKNFLEL